MFEREYANVIDLVTQEIKERPQWRFSLITPLSQINLSQLQIGGSIYATTADREKCPFDLFLSLAGFHNLIVLTQLYHFLKYRIFLS